MSIPSPAGNDWAVVVLQRSDAPFGSPWAPRDRQQQLQRTSAGWLQLIGVGTKLPTWTNRHIRHHPLSAGRDCVARTESGPDKGCLGAWDNG